MFQVDVTGPNRIDIALDGKLDSDGMRQALDELAVKSANIEHGRMLYRIGDFQMPTFAAIAVELSRLPQMFRMIHRFDRVAVLANQDWIKKMSEIEGMLIPGLDIKGFDFDQEAAAEAWLSE